MLVHDNFLLAVYKVLGGCCGLQNLVVLCVPSAFVASVFYNFKFSVRTGETTRDSPYSRISWSRNLETLAV